MSPSIGSRNATTYPSYVFQCKDGVVVLAAESDEEFQCLCQAMERPELAENVRFASLSSRIKEKNAAALHRLIRRWAKDKSVAQIDQLGAQYGFATSPLPHVASHPPDLANARAHASALSFEL